MNTHKIKRLRRRAAAFTLVELMVVVTMIGILTAFVAPSFQQAVEVARADQAIATLRTIWAAQRYYKLDNHFFASSVKDLRTAGLLDSSIPDSAADPDETRPDDAFAFAIDRDSASTTEFRATATRRGMGSTAWVGSFEINQDGQISGVIEGRIRIYPPREVR
jgi:prepilin-type N-terminal cleavage/methylation domain-containing protein